MKKLTCALLLAILPVLSHAGLGVTAKDFSDRFNFLDDNMDRSYPNMKLTQARGSQSVKLIKGQTLTARKSRTDIDKITLRCPNASRYADSCGVTTTMIAAAINPNADLQGLLDEVAASLGYLDGEFSDGDLLTTWKIDPIANTVTIEFQPQ